MAQYGYYYTKEDVDLIAQKYGWTMVKWQQEIYMVSYKKAYNGSTARINVYMTKGTVATSMEHPTKGKTQLFRKGILYLHTLEELFKNPRKHTGLGYYKK
jgi:hypothetical protein